MSRPGPADGGSFATGACVLLPQADRAAILLEFYARGAGGGERAESGRWQCPMFMVCRTAQCVAAVVGG